MLWTVPALLGIAVSLVFLYVLNKKKRKNIIKMAFSAYLILLVIFNALSIVRHYTTDVNHSLIISRMVLTFAIFSTTFFAVTAASMYDKKKVKWILLMFIPGTILSLLFWRPQALYDSGVDVRFGYGMEASLFSTYILFQSISYIITFTFLFLAYFRSKDEKFGYKIRYFILAAVICSLSLLLNRVLFASAALPLIQQTTNPLIAVSIMMYGYLKR